MVCICGNVLFEGVTHALCKEAMTQKLKSDFVILDSMYVLRK